jgi:hypothetical protein
MRGDADEADATRKRKENANCQWDEKGPPARSRGPNSLARDCEEEDYCRDEGSKPNYDSPDKACRFFFAVIAMGMPLHLNLQARSAGPSFNQNVSPGA